MEDLEGCGRCAGIGDEGGGFGILCCCSGNWAA